MPGKRKPRKTPTLAQRADRYDLYQQSVQEPEAEVRFFKRAYKDAFDRKPAVLREDFCGAAAVCAQWVRDKKHHEAFGVDLDPEPLAWGTEHNLGPLKRSQRARVELIEGDVRDELPRKADVIAGQNFSFFYFKTRPELLQYFAAAYANLDKYGVLVLDMLGGGESMNDRTVDVRDQDGFQYVWDQHRFDPTSHECDFRIHFRFPDGSELTNAFRYQWRFWTLPEVRELLTEAGFADVRVYWEGTDKDGDGNGVFKRRTKGVHNDPSWICYVVAVKGIDE